MTNLEEKVYMDYVCPICGAKVWSYSDPAKDFTLGEYCENDNCKWFANQFISYEDFLETEKEVMNQAICD